MTSGSSDEVGSCGVSGSQVWGYLSGNGLLSAVALGSIAGRAMAKIVSASSLS